MPKRKEEVSETPEAVLVFNEAVAREWLAKGYLRLKNAYASIRFEPEGIEEKHLHFVLRMAAEAIRGQYRIRRNYFRGVLYVPVSLAGHEVLAGLEAGEEIGGFKALRKPL